LPGGARLENELRPALHRRLRTRAALHSRLLLRQARLHLQDGQVHQAGVQRPAEQAGVPVFDTMAACSTCHREPRSLQEAEVDTCRCKDALTQEEPANPWAVDVGHPGKELCDVAPGCNAALMLEAGADGDGAPPLLFSSPPLAHAPAHRVFLFGVWFWRDPRLREGAGARGRALVGDDGAHARRARAQQIGGSGGSLEPPGPLLRPPRPLLTHLHTVYMVYSECLPTRLNPLAERTCFSQVMCSLGRAGHHLRRLPGPRPGLTRGVHRSARGGGGSGAHSPTTPPPRGALSVRRRRR
jgi:hypothetical protein